MSMGAYFSRHAQVFVGSLGRIVRQPFATFLTMGVIAVALALPLLLYLLLLNVRAATGSWNEAFDLSAYMAKGAPVGRTAAVARQLRLRGDVASVRIVTADQAMAEFRKTSGFGQALDALTDNPLPDTLVITPALSASTPDGTDTLRRAIAALPDVDGVQLDTDWVKRLHALLDLARRVLLLTAGILGLGVVLIVGNTIRLDILNRRAEIEVMKLVGATDRFARRPFLYSGVWYGLGGGLIALGLVGGAAFSLAEPVDALAQLYGSSFRLAQLPWSTDGGVVLAAVVLAWLGSWFAATRHIRGIEPN